MVETGLSLAAFAPSKPSIVGISYGVFLQPLDNAGAVVFTVPIQFNPADPTQPI